MKNLEIRIISGEVYVPLHAVVELLKQVERKSECGVVAPLLLQEYEAQKRGDTQFIPHEQDYQGLCR